MPDGSFSNIVNQGSLINDIRVSPVKINWHAGLTIYSSESYLKTLSDEYGWIGGIKSSGEPCCVIPYYIARTPLFKLVRLTSETIFLADEISIEEEREFLGGIVAYFRSVGADLIIPGSFSSLFRTYPNGAIAAPYGSYIVDLARSEEDLWNSVHPKHRNKIRNAIKKGVKVQQDNKHVNTACRLIRGSFKRSTKGVLNTLQLRIRMKDSSIRKEMIGMGDNAKLFIAECEGLIQGCAVIHFSDYCAYYMHGGSIDEPITGAMNLLQWEAMCFFRKLGVKYYNFVGTRINPESGSKQEGLSMFKRRFGGELKRGYMWKYSFHSLKYCLYSIASKIRSSGDIVDQERHKIKYV